MLSRTSYCYVELLQENEKLPHHELNATEIFTDIILVLFYDLLSFLRFKPCFLTFFLPVGRLSWKGVLHRRLLGCTAAFGCIGCGKN